MCEPVKILVYDYLSQLSQMLHGGTSMLRESRELC